MGPFFLVSGLLYTALALKGGGPFLILLWVGSGQLLAGVAYLGLGPLALGKRLDGSLWWPVLLVGGSFHALAWGAWAWRVTRRDLAAHEVAPGLWLGRRPRPQDVPVGMALLVDLTAELPAHPALRGARYRALPTLDGTAPEQAPFLALLDEVVRTEGPVYLHCAVGRGRSATLAAAVLLRRGLAHTVQEAEDRLRAVRPQVKLSPPQRELLRRCFPESAGGPA